MHTYGGVCIFGVLFVVSICCKRSNPEGYDKINEKGV